MIPGIGQTVYRTTIECPSCSHTNHGLLSDGQYYWCNHCGYGKGDHKIGTGDLPDVPAKIKDRDDNTGI